MNRRTGESTAAFGSDSFLDILANIVGILIILIVLAGLRVSQSPMTETKPSQSEKPASPPWQPVQAEKPARAEDRPSPVGPPSSEPPSQWQNRLEQLQAELPPLKARVARQRELAGQLQQQEQELQRKLKAMARELASRSAEVEQSASRLKRLQQEVDQLEDRRAAARRQLQEVQQSGPPVETIEHKVTPVSRKVTGEEIHFHLAKQQVAYIPLEKFLTRLRAEIGRAKEWLVEFNRHYGKIGPIQGFTMRYVVSRQQKSVLEELRSSSNVVRIGVSQWTIKPEPGPEAESAEQAVQPGSRFYRRLQKTPTETTLTFWVYPDSYRLFRKLQRLAHRQGFRVAARPLPFGVPIAGSPNGTPSAGQ